MNIFNVNKIIYYYDRDIKLYTFIKYDINQDQIGNADYCSKKFLITTKADHLKEYGIKPIRE